MKVTELFEEESDLLFWLQKLLDKGETVLLNAHSKGEHTGTRDIGMRSYKRHVVGRIIRIKDEHIIYDHSRKPREPGNVSNSFFMLQTPVDDSYKIHKIADGEWAGYYELVDA
jgi:hypothetical protein